MIGNYKVITLCGSTRFKDEFLQVQKELTLQGNIVISVGLFGHAGDFEVWENMSEGTLTKTKEILDDMHKRKIDMADEIFVINVGGYIGDSTKSEIEYAKEHDKIVRYLENNLNRDNINNAIYLDEYKNYLVNFYCWPMDNTKSFIKKRKEILTNKYSDNYLLKIISDTNSFAKDVLMSDTIDYGYFKIEVNDDEPLFINLELHGGWMSDTIYIDSKGRYISKHLIKTIFGKETIIELKIDEVERITDDNICSFDYRYYIYMQGFSENLNMIRNSILGDNKKLVKKRRKGDIV